MKTGIRWIGIFVLFAFAGFSILLFINKELIGIIKEIPSESELFEVHEKTLNYFYNHFDEMTPQEKAFYEKSVVYGEYRIAHYAGRVIKKLRQLRQLG